MMSGHTWKLMDWLSEHAGEADCRVEMTTNLAYDQDTLMRFLDACSRVSVPIWLFTSGECTEKKIEYVILTHVVELKEKIKYVDTNSRC